jgi:hypothetical protein
VVRDPLHADAARRQLIALESYETRFEAMVAGDMASDLYAAMNESLEQVRTAASMDPRNLLFNTTQLVLAHSNLTAKLWQRQVARQQGVQPLDMDREVQSLCEDHRRAVARLRDRCLSSVGKTP